MTERKPPNVSFPDWVERQIREAQSRGSFDNLPGTGKPIPGINQPWNEMSWVAAMMRRENLPVSAVLPPALALAKELEDLPALLSRQKSQAAVDREIADLSQRIRDAHRRPQVGPAVTVTVRDVENIVRAWREQQGR